MAGIYTSADQLIGKTPLLELARIEKELGLKARILAKLEYFNPSGSAKDRAAKSMLDQAEAEGRLKPGSVIIEPTSGNTGIGLAAVAAARGYSVTIVMPETMSVERQRLMKGYGADLVLTKGGLGDAGGHRQGGGAGGADPQQLYPRLDFFVATVGTGGTITGTGEFLKSKNPEIKVVAVEPASSPVLSGGKAGSHGIQGIGAGFVPAVLNTEIYDEVITVEDEDAFSTGRLVGRKEGVLVGISSGAALWAAVQLAKRPENEGKTIVALLPDGGSRYLSTPLFED